MIMPPRWLEQNAVLREDSREMVAWWYERTLPRRRRDAVVRRQRNGLLDVLAERILKSEAERQQRWRIQLAKTKTMLASRLDDLALDEKRLRLQKHSRLKLLLGEKLRRKRKTNKKKRGKDKKNTSNKRYAEEKQPMP